MDIKVKVLSGRRELRQAMAATQGKQLPDDCKPLSEEGMLKALLSQHGTLNKYIFHVKVTAPDRVHTHLRTHHLVNEFYQCSTSRPDWSEDTGAMRVIDVFIPVKRLIEMSGLRLCYRAWKDTREFFEKLRMSLTELEPHLNYVLNPRCVQFGYCPELDKCCGYIDTQEYEIDRSTLLQAVRRCS